MEGSLALLIPIFAVAGFFGWLIALSPLGRAYAERLRGQGSPGASGAEHAALAQDVEGRRRELGELAERVDYTERLLASPREAERRGPAR